MKRLLWLLTTSVRCAWCNLTLRRALFQRSISHGICQPCADKVLGGNEASCGASGSISAGTCVRPSLAPALDLR